MAAKSEATEIMSAAELKPLLKLSRHRPVNCVIAMTKNKQGVILMHRRTKPRKLMAELRRQATAAGMELNTTSIRFGRATVDGASDSAMVRFTVNKPAPGTIRVALLEQLRPAGFQRCEIAVDEALETETEDGEDADDEADPHATAQDGFFQSSAMSTEAAPLAAAVAGGEAGGSTPGRQRGTTPHRAGRRWHGLERPTCRHSHNRFAELGSPDRPRDCSGPVAQGAPGQTRNRRAGKHQG